MSSDLTTGLPVYDENKVAAELKRLGFPVKEVYEWDQCTDAGVCLTDEVSLQLPFYGGICVNRWDNDKGVMHYLATNVLFDDAVAVLRTLNIQEVK